MAEINTTKNAVEIRSELKKNGTMIEFITINGQKIGMLGSVNEEDKANALKALNDAYIASGGNVYEMMMNLSIIAIIEEKQIDPDEMVEVNGTNVMLSYTNKAAYTMDGEELVNCKDLPDMPKEAVKAVLVARAEAALN